MSGGIEEPYSIATLPTPFNADTGRILAAPVQSISGSRKRKRHEVAVGIDGESVNIYSVQNQSTVSSYALSPQCTLAAPPCSVYCKRSKQLQPQRRTYLALHDGSKARLVTITEELGKLRSEEREPRAPAKKARKLRHKDISGLEVIQLDDDRDCPSSKSGVLVFYAAGDIDCITGDLAGTRWEHTTTESGIVVEHSSVVTLEAARKGLLRNREDILSILDPSTIGANSGAPLLLFQSVRLDNIRRVRIYALRNVSGDTLSSARSPLEEILSYDLPSRRQNFEDPATYELHAASGTLYQLARRRLTLFDLSGTFPRIAAEPGRKAGVRFNSFARLSAASVVAVSQDRIDVYDTKFGSILSSLTLAKQNDTSSMALKIVANFADPGMFVAICRSDLMVVQLGDVANESRHAKSAGPLLAQVIGKGKASADIHLAGSGERTRKKQKSWEEWTAKVDGLIEGGDIAGLESLIAQELGLETALNIQDFSLTNGDSAPDHQTEKWTLKPTAYDPQHIDAKKASYILGRVFGWQAVSSKTNSKSNIVVKIKSRNILCWLLMAGYLAPAHIESALPASSSMDGDRPHVASGDVTSAISDIDTNFALLCDLATIDAHWPLSEVIQGLKIVMESLEGIAPSTQGLIANSDTTMVDVDDQLQAELQAADAQMGEAEDILASGEAVRSETLRVLLARLSGFPQNEVSGTMSLMWNHDDILFFIAILRHELIEGGWTKLYVDPEEDLSMDGTKVADSLQDFSPRNEAIRTIATLFSCAIDAIGLSGWLVGLSGDPERTTELMQSLRNEISAVVEGLYADAALGNSINELSKTAGSIEAPTLKRKRQQEPADAVLDAGRIVMPLGGRFEAPATRSWNIAEQKSRAAEAEQKNRAVGKYSFERIRI